MTGAAPLAEFQDLTRRAEQAGYAGLVVTEAGRTAYLSCAAAALTGADLDLATGVAVAFPRSAMVTAANAWELAQATNGRFRLGLGPQVRAHVERRYSSEFSPPGPRLEEYVRALRAIFAAYRGERLDFHGTYSSFTLLPAMWSPGPIPVPDPPIDVAAVNPWMLRMAGEVADGVHAHPINTVAYATETLLPNLGVGANRGGRALEDLTVFLPLFTVPTDTASERARWRETTRTMVGFYGSTPNYAFIFEQLGRPGTTEALREAQQRGDTTAMTAVVDDDLLEHFVVEASWSGMADAILRRCAPLAGTDVQVVLYLAGMTAAHPGDTFERFGAVARALRDA
jgi:probable F420-dependent oxidoreductase